MKRLILILSLTIPLMLSAQRMPMHHQRPDFDGERGLKGVEQLELTDAQEDQLHKIRLDFQKSQITLRADYKLANIDLQEMIANDETGKKLDAGIEKVANLKSQLFKARIAHRLEVRKVLTEEQKAELKKIRRNPRPGFGRKTGCKGNCDDDDNKPKVAPGHPRHRDR